MMAMAWFVDLIEDLLDGIAAGFLDVSFCQGGRIEISPHEPPSSLSLMISRLRERPLILRRSPGFFQAWYSFFIRDRNYFRDGFSVPLDPEGFSLFDGVEIRRRVFAEFGEGYVLHMYSNVHFLVHLSSRPVDLRPSNVNDVPNKFLTKCQVL